MDDRQARLREVLHRAGETHHVVFAIVDGADDDWASWYSEWLLDHSELPEILGTTPIRSELTTALVLLARDYADGRAEEPWEDAYARGLIERFAG